jgi:medium-chain acyl-[acyl-carrier-protein] hydrolase
MTPSPDFIKVWKDTYTIHSYQVDIRSKATLVALCQLLQESAWQHAEHMGLGFSHLRGKNFIWVLARQLIKINSYPKWGDTIEVHTWPTGKDRIFCYRDFKILEPNGSTVAEASTTWFVIDLVTRKLQKTALYYHVKLPEDVEIVFPNRLHKLEPVESEDFTTSLRVSYGDLDMHKHVNNVRYIEWIMNCLPLELMSTYFLKEIEINYMSEASYQDEIAVSYEKKGKSTFLHKIVRKNDNTEICRARTTWASQGT